MTAGWADFQGRPLPGVADFIKAVVSVRKWASVLVRTDLYPLR